MQLVRSLMEVVFVAVVLFEIIIPALRGTPFFPRFRRETKLLHEIEEARQGRLERRLEMELGNLKAADNCNHAPHHSDRGPDYRCGYCGVLIQPLHGMWVAVEEPKTEGKGTNHADDVRDEERAAEKRAG